MCADAGNILLDAYHRDRPMLLRLLITRTRDKVEAEDVLQELWLKLRNASPDHIEDARSYVFRAAQNLLKDRIRIRQRQMVRDRRWSDETTGFATSIDELPDRDRSAEEAILAREEIAILASAINNLPRAARRAFELHKFDGLSHTEVAERLGISKSGVEKHMALAMKHLKRAFLD